MEAVLSVVLKFTLHTNHTFCDSGDSGERSDRGYRIRKIGRTEGPGIFGNCWPVKEIQSALGLQRVRQLREV